MAKKQPPFYSTFGLPRQQQGVNLIELMIAITISLIVLAGASVILVNSNKSSRIQKDLVSMQENARFTLQQISSDLQLSGYYGCVQDINPIDPAGPIINNLDDSSAFINTPIRGYEHSATPEMVLTEDGRDVLEIQFAEPVTELSADMVNLQSNIPVADASEFSVNDIVMIANCEYGDIFTISAISGNSLSHQTNTTSGETLVPANLSDSLSAWYPRQSYAIANANVTRLFKFNRVKYYVTQDLNNDGDTDDAGEDVPSLMRVVNRGTDVSGTADDVFVRGVESMEVLYGEDTDGDSRPDAYVDANAVGTWGNVAAVRFALLMRTENEYGNRFDQDQGTQSGEDIDVLGTDFTPGDERVRRRLFQTTVFVRNSI